MPKHSPLSTLRRTALHAQGLTKVAPFGTGKNATLKAIEHLGYVQIDTLAVVERAHHHTLWTRIPSYKPQHLAQLLAERKIFEHWSHAAAFLPMRDYRFALPRMNAVRRGESRWLASVSNKDETEVLARIRSEGPLRARDFESPKKNQGSWWNWKPAKKTLEKLFFQGDLMISSREGMQKLYDLRERVLPSTVDTHEPALVEFAEHLIDSALNAHGFAFSKQITHLRQGANLRHAVTNILQDRIDRGLLAQYSIDDLPIFYAAPNLLDQKILNPRGIHILSPFDNAVIHRDRLEKLFDYSYTIECYVPKPKRQFGYFCLPIVYGDQLVGRADCKANRKTKELAVLNLYIEKPLKNEEIFLKALNTKLERFAAFNGCESFVIQRKTNLE